MAISNPVLDTMSRQEDVQKLIDAGYGYLVEILLEGDSVYTKRGRMNKSALCRTANIKSKVLEDALKHCREILTEDEREEETESEEE